MHSLEAECSAILGYDADGMLERQRVDDVALLIFRVDAVAQVQDPVSDVTRHQIANAKHHGRLELVHIAVITAVGIEKLVGAVAQA